MRWVVLFMVACGVGPELDQPEEPPEWPTENITDVDKSQADDDAEPVDEEAEPVDEEAEPAEEEAEPAEEEAL